jgi:hypothetical protein
MRNLIFIFLIITCKLHAQSDYRLVYSIPLKEEKFTTDRLGNFYFYHQGDISKYDPAAKLSGSYSTRDYGNIGYIDASDPLKVLVVFPEFSKAVILDAAMSANSNIELSLPEIPNIRLICTSRQQGFWIFDEYSNRLKKLDEQLTVIAEGTDLRQITPGKILPDMLVESGDWVFLNAPGYGVLVFDRYGTYFKTLQPDVQSFLQVHGNEILYKEGIRMVRFNILTSEKNYFVLPENFPQDEVRIEAHRIFIRKDDRLEIYDY